MFQNLGANKQRPRKLKVREAAKLLLDEEAAKLVNEEELRASALRNAEQNGIVFIDEIDKVCRRQDSYGADVSREGVQIDGVDAVGISFPGFFELLANVARIGEAG